ncbi:KilA-N domain-containing protein [Vibrio neptunius]|uniref:KilA-N domain-containing protein n=1 Tax=Vibrio neptunius TaxID=170651 RepID=A0ABS3AA69_9VIBR|nr:KilA-N domain-containing protein [Vibrio neptunius]MBN3495508.1 KilA-N domain-containing protein [Vibrio neptunius]MBN3517514.1 KilA-N domain-containing protein [Vibrio neptunius]MBN3551851.1 KilA-N domain-containing protein [Vibrio neptunius]MBN3580298.1 KilA-N domain-containing protein [Vibrio neptunius]MCH9873964.1 KilA-N domain-containing protein [Vibrio neptunius]
MTNLTILSKEVRTIDNLFSLNDLHKASGAIPKHAPFRFMRNDQTLELIAEIERSPDLVIGSKVIRGGKQQGTWVCKELVYSYAMWISPKFHLQVIRAFERKPPKLPSPTISHDLSLNDLIYELAKAKHVTTQNIHNHYNSVFNTNAWSQAQGFEHALAKRILKQDLANALRTQTPELQSLRQQAKLHGLSLVDEREYQAFQGRMQMQQQQIDKLADDVMALSRNHNALMSQVL